MCRINRHARKAKRQGDRRCIDQIRADISLDLLTERDVSSPFLSCAGTPLSGGRNDRAVVDIRADLTTLIGLDENPGEIPGWGPVIADVVRQIVANTPAGDWRYAITHQSELLDVITTRRRPTAAQKRLIETLDPKCVWPTCREPSVQCDLDHQIPWAESHQTSVRGQEPLCSHHHHHAKHGHWELRQARPGTYVWTSPLGHTYTTQPDPPDDPDPP